MTLLIYAGVERCYRASLTLFCGIYLSRLTLGEKLPKEVISIANSRNYPSEQKMTKYLDYQMCVPPEFARNQLHSTRGPHEQFRFVLHTVSKRLMSNTESRDFCIKCHHTEKHILIIFSHTFHLILTTTLIDKEQIMLSCYGDHRKCLKKDHVDGDW